MGTFLAGFGLALVVLGLIFNMMPQRQLPMLPGDIYIQQENFTLYVPFMSAFIISIVLTIVASAFHK